MPMKTTNLRLTKPLLTENYDVGVWNTNSDIVDEAVSNCVVKNDDITPNTAIKVTYDAKGLITDSAELLPDDIPELDITKIVGLEQEISDSTWNVPDLVKFKGAIELDSDTYTTAKLNAKNAALFDTLERPLRGMYWYYVKAKTLDGYTQDSSGNLVQSPYYMPWGILIDVPYPFDGEYIEQAEQKEGNPNVIPSPVIDDGSSYTRLQRLELMTSPTSEKRRVFVRRLVCTPSVLGNYGEPEWEEWKKADAELATKKYVDSKISAEKVSVVDSLADESSDKALSANQGKILNEKIASAKIYADSVSWNAQGVLEYKGVIDLTNIDYQRENNYFLGELEDLTYFSDVLDNLENPVEHGVKYFYWVKLKGQNGGEYYDRLARLLDDGSSGASGDGYLTNRTQTIYLDNGQVFQRSRNSSYNDEMENIEYWEAWTPTSSVPYATSEVRGAVKVGGIAANNSYAAMQSYAVMQRANIGVTDFNKTDYTYNGQYSVSFNGNASGAPQGLDSDTRYYGVLTTENYSNTNTASSNYGVYQKLSIPILNRTYERYVYDGAERYGDWTCITEAIKPLTVDNWKAVQEIVRSGMARQVFNIGDQLVCQRNGQDLVWDIIGIDHDTPSDSQYTHSMTLQLHDCIRPASAAGGICGRQALFYAEEELPAGTYNFTLTANGDTANGGGKTYSFTLTQAVPAGGQIVFDWDSGQAAAALIKTYSSYSSTIAIESVSVTEGANGTDLSEIGQYNNAWYIHYGSNNYINSAARQYLNSSGGANEWWMPKTNLERAYTRLTSCPGFLNGIDSDFLEVLGAVNKSVILNTVAEGGVTEVFADKVFLLSAPEAYVRSGDAEGNAYEYYEKYSDLESPSGGADSNRIKTSNGNNFGWWLRSCSTNSGSLLTDIEYTGSTGSHYASHGYADFAPACCIV